MVSLSVGYEKQLVYCDILEFELGGRGGGGQRVMQHGQRATISAGLGFDELLDLDSSRTGEGFASATRLTWRSKSALGNELGSLKVTGEGDTGDAAVAVTGVLLGDSAELWVGVGLLGHDGTGDRDEFLFAVVRVMEQGRTPSVASDGATSHKDGSGGELAWQVMQKVVRLERAIQNVAGELHNLLVGVAGLEETNQEHMSTWNGDVVLERLEDLLFHGDDLQCLERDGAGEFCEETNRKSIIESQ